MVPCRWLQIWSSPTHFPEARFWITSCLPTTCPEHVLPRRSPKATALLIEVSPNVLGDALAPSTIFLASARRTDLTRSGAFS